MWAPSEDRPSAPPWRDAALVAAVTAAAAFLCTQLNIAELLRRVSAPWEQLQLDELPVVLLVLTAGLTWFAARRYYEAGRQIERRRAAESQLETALAANRRLSQQYVELQEAERKSLARELHDELGQYLNVIKIDAVGIRDHGYADAQALRERAGAIVANCNHIHAALADLIRQLRPVGLDELGLAAALEHCIETWRARLPSAALQLCVTGDFSGLPESVALTAYRLVQEALTNVAKHAGARHVAIRLERESSHEEPSPQTRESAQTRESPQTREPPQAWESPQTRGSPQSWESPERRDVISLIVRDDGKGAELSLPTSGLGLIGMRERVAALEGELTVASSPDEGFELRARIPVQPARSYIGTLVPLAR